MMYSVLEKIRQLQRLDFNGKGEEYVESKYLTPLLECLGYESHKDYDVIRHGDDNSTFKLKYPPVEKGAVKVKHYNPDYIPTIRKKAFWIIEAKSPKSVNFPFEPQYLVQGLQYCIHPEIQAKYLVVSTGALSAIYDAHGSVFMEKEIYSPILEFKSSELGQKWPEIYDFLSVEKLRERVEGDLKVMYDKLALSSLDENYPSELLQKIGAMKHDHAMQIRRHVLKLQVESWDRELAAWREHMEGLSASAVFALMDNPLRAGDTEARFFVEKSLAAGKSAQEIFSELTRDYLRQSIFRKEQTFVGVCVLYKKTENEEIRKLIRTFIDQYKDAELPLLNQAECVALRTIRKLNIVASYPTLRKIIHEKLQSMPEIIRYVQPPTALNLSYVAEIAVHRRLFQELGGFSEEILKRWLDPWEKAEAELEKEFQAARSKLTSSESEIAGFEYYGVDGHHYAFRNIVRNYGLEESEN